MDSPTDRQTNIALNNFTSWFKNSHGITFKLNASELILAWHLHLQHWKCEKIEKNRAIRGQKRKTVSAEGMGTVWQYELIPSSFQHSICANWENWRLSIFVNCLQLIIPKKIFLKWYIREKTSSYRQKRRTLAMSHGDRSTGVTGQDMSLCDGWQFGHLTTVHLLPLTWFWGVFWEISFPATS